MNEYLTNTHTFSNPETLITTTATYQTPNQVAISSGRWGYPNIATQGSAGFDVPAEINHPISINPGETMLIPTGIKLGLPDDVACLILPRSGLAMKHGITVANTPGLIDPDYRGEVMVLLRNEGTQVFTVNDGDRIAQFMFINFIRPSFVSVEELDQTDRGSGGFGSTDRN